MKTTFENFQISEKYTGSKKAPWAGGPENWNHHIITVTNRDNGKRTQFDFWQSIKEVYIKSEYDLLNAFFCFVSDATIGAENFSDFCAEFGYSEDSRNAERTWRACKRAADKFKRVSGFDLDDPEFYEFFDRLQEKGG